MWTCCACSAWCQVLGSASRCSGLGVRSRVSRAVNVLTAHRQKAGLFVTFPWHLHPGAPGLHCKLGWRILRRAATHAVAHL